MWGGGGGVRGDADGIRCSSSRVVYPNRGYSVGRMSSHTNCDESSVMSVEFAVDCKIGCIVLQCCQISTV